MNSDLLINWVLNVSRKVALTDLVSVSRICGIHGLLLTSEAHPYRQSRSQLTLTNVRSRTFDTVNHHRSNTIFNETTQMVTGTLDEHNPCDHIISASIKIRDKIIERLFVNE